MSWQKITPDNLPPEGVPVFVRKTHSLILIPVYRIGIKLFLLGYDCENGRYIFGCNFLVGYAEDFTHYHQFPSLEGVE